MDFLQLKTWLTRIAVFIFSGVIVAIAMNNFLIPNNIFSSGFNGVAQLIALFIEAVFHTQVDVGVIIMIFNLPILLIGLKFAGKRFTLISFLNSFFISFMMIVMPQGSVVDHEPILAGLFGGLLVGVAIGLTFKFGFSTGGMDIIAMAVQKATGKSIGSISMFINGAIVIIAGAFIGWQNAMYTIIGIYATSVAIDSIHTRYQKLTVFIVTRRANEVAEALQNRLIRGITIMPSMGAFSHEASSTLMMVISKYEVAEVTEVTKMVDQDAFLNIVETVEVPQNFYNEDLQAQIRNERRAAKNQIDAALNVEETMEQGQ
ncbi:YitT family protein [Weissella tructae]|jgi:uncharacterized membrane-anchored protein YitT (DUF2179 family)|uniref:Integral inner membrane protein n=2 Tax=Weissella TaxID=46255 RepID=A0ABN4DG58_9LACO|nr:MULTISPECIES: YitT family protein [Weissella]AIG65281.1 Putative integral inner membrane protein [Weissella tructae]AIM62594.1 Putative integral inner membrane protein [Weissella ceti]AIM63930.1 Putative integral inner membrane protein [Weissella ceti]ELA07683.1 YitT family protein [Weissella ceti NC36]QVV91662.1 YitT family protein [Weissella tructae]